MSRREENAGFVCRHCRQDVAPLSNGSYRNHCPSCLYSLHTDLVPGDRASACGGLMAPVRLTRKAGKGFQIVHRCLRCGKERVNRVAEYTRQPDDVEELIRLMAP